MRQCAADVWQSSLNRCLEISSVRGRDGCRVPVPWSGDSPSYGFGQGDASWLPQPEDWAGLGADDQTGVAGSTLELYRTLLHTRRELRLGRGELNWLDGYPDEVLAFSVKATEGSVTVLANLGDEPLPLPEGATVLASSQPLEPGALVGTDETVWLRP